MNEAQLFGQHCKLTCLGGSERGTCSCHSPADCPLQANHPNFLAWRERALNRMLRFLDRTIIRYVEKEKRCS